MQKKINFILGYKIIKLILFKKSIFVNSESGEDMKYSAARENRIIHFNEDLNESKNLSLGANLVM